MVLHPFRTIFSNLPCLWETDMPLQFFQRNVWEWFGDKLPEGTSRALGHLCCWWEWPRWGISGLHCGGGNLQITEAGKWFWGQWWQLLYSLGYWELSPETQSSTIPPDSPVILWAFFTSLNKLALVEPELISLYVPKTHPSHFFIPPRINTVLKIYEWKVLSILCLNI